MQKPVLVFGYGNLSRGDDALGPLLLEHLASHCNLSEVEILEDFQLQVENALDLENRSLVLFVDASVSCAGAFDFAELKPAADSSYTTHALSPEAVLAVYQSIKQQVPPPCFLLGIKGERFELGEPLSANAHDHLQSAIGFAKQLLQNKDAFIWRQFANKA